MLTDERLKDPVTTNEWQLAVDAATAWLQIIAAADNGLTLLRNAPTVNTRRCHDLLVRGKSLGITPHPDALVRLLTELNTH